MGDASNWTGTEVSGNSVTEMTFIKVQPIDYLRQQDGARSPSLGRTSRVSTLGPRSSCRPPRSRADRRTYLKGESELQVTLRVQQAPAGNMTLGSAVWLALWQVHRDRTGFAPAAPAEMGDPEPASALPRRGHGFREGQHAFILGTSGKARIDVATVRWVPASVGSCRGGGSARLRGQLTR